MIDYKLMAVAPVKDFRTFKCEIVNEEWYLVHGSVFNGFGLYWPLQQM